MLKLSTKGRYATRIMLYLAMREGTGPARKQEIADTELISADYVEQILIRLKAAGLVTSHRGAKGGFALARRADEITVAQILTATEGELALAPCSDGACPQESICVTREIWSEAEDALRAVFEGRTLTDLVRRAEKLRGETVLTYSI